MKGVILMKYEKSCGAIVFKNHLQEILYLIVQMNVGHYSFPKGHVEENETEHVTALREIKEETNLDCVIIDGYREVVTYSPYKGGMKDVVYFLAEATSFDIQKQDTEIQAIEWLTYEEAFSRLTYENDKNLLEMAKKFLGSLAYLNE